MKSLSGWLRGSIVIGVIGYLGLSGYIYYYDKQRIQTVTPSISSSYENIKLLETLESTGCDYCHMPSTPLPFYSKLPIAKQLMEYDVNLGYKSFDFTPIRNSLINGTQPPESDLSKLEWVIEHNTMPPARYTSLHWSGFFKPEEKERVLRWIKGERQKYYAHEKTSEKTQHEPIQPIPLSLPVQKNKAALGSLLYHDPRLSKDNSISCASCHQLDMGGTDNKKTSIGVNGQIGPINAPTVFNSVFNVKQFWDGRANNLQEQAGGPPLNPIEMASSSWQEIIEKLNKDLELKKQFTTVYPEGFTEMTITDAIAEFEKTLITVNSPFDQYLRGNDNALTAQQLRGYSLFKENKCATCHVGKTLGGQSFEPLGLKKDFAFSNITNADLGVFNITKNERDRFRQKVPTLRNISETAPYFHRGDIKTLDEAVKLMLEYQVGKTLPQKDIDDIIAFLNSLTGSYISIENQKNLQ